MLETLSAQRLKASRDTEARARGAAEALIKDMLVGMREKLRPLNKVELLDDAGGAILDGGTIAGIGSVGWEAISVLRGGVHLGTDIVTTVAGVGNASTQVTNDGIIFIGDEGTLSSGIRLLSSTRLLLPRRLPVRQ